MVSTIIGQYIYKLLHRQPICSFLSYINTSEFPTVRSLSVCREELGISLEDA